MTQSNPSEPETRPAEARTAILAGVQAGLLGVLLALSLGLFTWLADLQGQTCALQIGLVILSWVATGVLAAYWMGQDCVAQWEMQALAGAMAGVLAGASSGISIGVFNLTLGETLNSAITAQGYSKIDSLQASLISIACCIGPVATFAGGLTSGISALIAGGIMKQGIAISLPWLASKPQAKAMELQDDAGPDLGKLFDQRPTVPKAPKELLPAVVALQIGDQETSISILNRVVRDHPDHAEAWLWMAKAHADPSRKRDCLQRVLALQPDNVEAKSMLQALVRSLTLMAEEDPLGVENGP